MGLILIISFPSNLILLERIKDEVGLNVSLLWWSFMPGLHTLLHTGPLLPVQDSFSLSAWEDKALQ